MRVNCCFVLVALALVACPLPVDIDGKACPCARDYVCCEASNVCRPAGSCEALPLPEPEEKDAGPSLPEQGVTDGGEVDAGLDAGIVFVTPLAWNEPQVLEGINTERFEIQPTLTADRLRLCFASDRDQPNPGDFRIYCATRATADGSFQAPTLQSQTYGGSGIDWDPELSSAGDELYFVSTRGNQQGLFVARWDAPSGQYIDARPMTSLNTSRDESGVALSPDGLTLYFDRWNLDEEVHLFSARRETRDSKFGPAAPIVLFSPKNPRYQETTAAPSGNEIILCRYETVGGSAEPEIWIMRKADSAWQAPVPLELGSGTPIGCGPELASNGELFFNLSVPGMNQDIVFATPKAPR